MRPVAAGVDDDEFVAASSLAEFGGIGAGGDANGFFVNQSSALRLGEGEACGKKQADEQEMRVPEMGIATSCGGTPPPPWSIGIMGLGENLEKIQGLQSVTGKILGTKELAASLWASSMRVLMHSESAFRVVEVKVI